MNILIVEDEIIIAAELSQILTEMGYTVCGMAVNYSNAIALLKNEAPDLAIVDINIGGSKTGVDVGNFINENNKIPFIYLTSNVDKTTFDSALKTKPNAYLPKPFDRTAIYTAISLALQNKEAIMQNKEASTQTDLIITDALFIKDKDLFQKVAFDTILFFKSDKNYIEVVTPNKIYLIRSTLSTLQDQLPTKSFIKIHRSYIVNIDKISAINHEVLFINEVAVPINTAYRDLLLQKVKTFS